MRECYLTAIFFETGTMTTPTKLQNPTILGFGVPARLLPNGYTLVGFAIGTLGLPTMANSIFKEHCTKNCFFLCSNLVFKTT